MITRPLDLTSRLRPPPRGFDALFFVNVVALGLFFMMFGAPFVLYPGVRLGEFSGAAQTAQPTDLVIAVRSANMVVADGAVLNFDQLQAWLRRRAAGRSGLRLLVQADAGLPAGDLFKLNAMAQAAGFTVQVAAEPAAK